VLVQIKIPDETYELYGRRNPENPRAALELTLQAFAELDPRGAGLVLTAEELRELNTLLGHPISSSKELLEHVGRSQRVTLGEGVEVPLNIGQRMRLKAQADFFAQSFPDFVKKQVAAGVVAVVGP
jgi:hypothetical protein